MAGGELDRKASFIDNILSGFEKRSAFNPVRKLQAMARLKRMKANKSDAFGAKSLVDSFKRSKNKWHKDSNSTKSKIKKAVGYGLIGGGTLAYGAKKITDPPKVTHPSRMPMQGGGRVY